MLELNKAIIESKERDYGSLLGGPDFQYVSTPIHLAAGVEHRSVFFRNLLTAFCYDTSGRMEGGQYLTFVSSPVYLPNPVK